MTEIMPETRHRNAIVKLDGSDDAAHKRRGRKSLFREVMMREGEKLGGYGLTLEEIADFWNVHRATLDRWTKSHPEFRDIIKRGKLMADLKVDERLFKRATGYEYKEKKYGFYYVPATVDDKGNVLDTKRVMTLVEEKLKEMPPDTTACIYWTKNRRPDKWRDRQEFGIGAMEDDDREFQVKVIHVNDDGINGDGKDKDSASIEDGDGKGGDGK